MRLENFASKSAEKNKDKNPIFYKNAEEMDKPLSVLMQQLRTDLTTIRGKLYDIKRSYGWEDRIAEITGGLTCMLVAMYHTMDEWKEFERKHNDE
jgi:hypothetical protein